MCASRILCTIGASAVVAAASPSNAQVPAADAIQVAALQSPRIQTEASAPAFKVVFDARTAPPERERELAAALGVQIAAGSERLRCTEVRECELLPRGTKVITIEDPTLVADTATVVVRTWFTAARPYDKTRLFLAGTKYMLSLRRNDDGRWFVFRVAVTTT